MKALSQEGQSDISPSGCHSGITVFPLFISEICFCSPITDRERLFSSPIASRDEALEEHAVSFKEVVPKGSDPSSSLAGSGMRDVYILELTCTERWSAGVSASPSKLRCKTLSVDYVGARIFDVFDRDARR